MLVSIIILLNNDLRKSFNICVFPLGFFHYYFKVYFIFNGFPYVWLNLFVIFVSFFLTVIGIASLLLFKGNLLVLLMVCISCDDLAS